MTKKMVRSTSRNNEAIFFCHNEEKQWTYPTSNRTRCRICLELCFRRLVTAFPISVTYQNGGIGVSSRQYTRTD